MNNININITELISLKLNLEGYLVLYCLYHKEKTLLRKYTTSCRKIDTEVFQELQKEEFITIANNSGNLYYESLSLTDKGSQSVEAVSKDSKPLESDSNLKVSHDGFTSFRSIYPNTVRRGEEKRQLHTDLERSEKLYNKLLLETTHDILCKAAKAYHEEHIKRNSEIFMKALPTWLNQKVYLAYIDNLEETNEEITNLDAI